MNTLTTTVFGTVTGKLPAQGGNVDHIVGKAVERMKENIKDVKCPHHEHLVQTKVEEGPVSFSHAMSGGTVSVIASVEATIHFDHLD